MEHGLALWCLLTAVQIRVNLIAAPFAAFFLSLALFPVGCSHTRPKGLVVRIAGLGRCNDVRTIVLEVLPGRILRLNSENQKREELEHRLEEIFRTRAYRYVFVIGDPNVSFEDVAEVIDMASKQVDYVALLTPSVLGRADFRDDGTCIDPNLPTEYIAHPPRQ